MLTANKYPLAKLICVPLETALVQHLIHLLIFFLSALASYFLLATLPKASLKFNLSLVEFTGKHFTLVALHLLSFLTNMTLKIYCFSGFSISQ